MALDQVGESKTASKTIEVSSINSQQENIKVAVRLRPFTDKEKQKKNRRIIEIEKNTVLLQNPKHSSDRHKRFTFDYSYWSHDGFMKNELGVNISDPNDPHGSKYVDQEKVFSDLGHFLLDNALKGYHSALLAYGQTGSGKSYTVSGYGANEGILPRFARTLFLELDKRTTKNEATKSDDETETQASKGLEKTEDDEKNEKYEVHFSMIEIYNEVVRDLLDKNEDRISSGVTRRGLKVREHPIHGFFVENLSAFVCNNKEEIEQRIEEGQLNKSIAATRMNETSSRGHTIYEFNIVQYKLSNSKQINDELVTKSVVQLVDLAGSERTALHGLADDTNIGKSLAPIEHIGSSLRYPGSARDSSPQGNFRKSVHNGPMQHNSHQRFKESVSINQSLSALGNCIQVMSQYSQQLEHFGNDNRGRVPTLKIPYRDSVLTKLLNRCCLSGNSKVVIIATLSPADIHFDDTLSTLRFADRAKQIRTHAKINQVNIDDRGDSGPSKTHKRHKHVTQSGNSNSKSDESSQTSNFDSNENAVDNFTGVTIKSSQISVDLTAAPTRNTTTSRKTTLSQAGNRRTKDKTGVRVTKGGSNLRLTGSTSNPALAMDPLRRLVSPASTKIITDSRGKIRKSKSTGLVSKSGTNSQFEYESLEEETLKDYDDADIDLRNIREGLISPESDDSLAALADEDLSTDEKIEILNRILNNSGPSERIQTIQEEEGKPNEAKSKQQRARRSKMRAEIKQVSIISSTLKKTNPYLSNLNPDEQLSGVINFIIKQGDTIIGKDSNCDVVLHGPEIRGKHAKIIRIDSRDESAARGEKKPPQVDSNDKQKNIIIYLEPFNSDIEGKDDKDHSNIKVNGSLVKGRLKLNHCDRILFGTNSYFVLANLHDKTSSKDKDQVPIADLDLVTYEMARNEVLKSVIAEERNKEVLKEIKDYTHRPGTGKHRSKGSDAKRSSINESVTKQESVTRFSRSMTLQGSNNDGAQQDGGTKDGDRNNSVPYQNGNDEQDTVYRDQLMEDTYEYVIPVAEVNAVAEEMGIKVSYELKILTGEEQWSNQTPNYYDVNTSDGFSSSSVTDSVDTSEARNRVSSGEGREDSQNNNTLGTHSDDDVTYLSKIDYLDIPPALHVKVHIQEGELDFYWSKEKFQARRFKILELYSPWSVGGKSALVEYLIEQSRSQGNYLIDPFVDAPSSTFVFIGHSQIILQPIAHLTDKRQTYDIVGLNDEILGSVDVEAIPCHPELEVMGDLKKFKLYSEEELNKNLLDDPKKLLGQKLVFMLKIIACHDISTRYNNIFCQYILNPKNSVVRTKMFHDDDSQPSSSGHYEEMKFEHSHYICFESVTDDILDFLQYGFLTIQVVGQYRIQAGQVNRQPSVVSTIINSINKYRYKMEQRSGYASANYSTGDFYSNSVDSMKSDRDPQPGGTANEGSEASSAASTGTTNLYDQRNEFDESGGSVNGIPQENIIDMILTKRKLDRAENQLVSFG